MVVRILALAWTAFWLAGAALTGWGYYQLYRLGCFEYAGCFIEARGVMHDADSVFLFVLPIGCLAAASVGVLTYFLARKRTPRVAT